MSFFLHVFFSFAISCIFFFFVFSFFKPVLFANSLLFPYAVNPFDICKTLPVFWQYLKIIYLISLFISCFIFGNSIYSLFFKKVFSTKKKKNRKPKKIHSTNLSLLIGQNIDCASPVYLPEKSLYQNILITGTIGSGKTSSCMYPFVKQLISYQNNSFDKKIGMLILDVKGNFHKQVKEYCKKYERLDDLITLEIGGKYKYNPLDKPNLKPSVLASRLKNILLLFSPETSESFWLDKAEQVLAEGIKLCRLYNDGYVTFAELHKLITNSNYYAEKINFLRDKFLLRKLSPDDTYNFYSALNFFEHEFKSLDSKILSTLKSEITRITNTFVSEKDILETFCPDKSDISFNGFSDVIKNGKIVVLNMNISEYKNLSKIIAAYLKLDFQTEALINIANNSTKTTAFICDEYHEYVTANDASFFAQSRESKVINIVATQSYTSILNTLKNEASTKVIIQNLINKLWFRTDDVFTIENAQKQIGKEDKTKILKSISENAEKTNYNYFTNSLNSKNSSVSESISTCINFDFVYDTNFFTSSLETFTALAFLSDGTKILNPQKLKMLPYFYE